MTQTVFFDTNVIPDYLENRNEETRDIVAQLIFLHDRNKVLLTTSVFNVAELIDKEFEIHFMKILISERLSYDEIFKKRSDRKLFREMSEKAKEKIENSVRKFIFKNRIDVLTMSFENEDNEESRGYGDLYDLIYKHQFSSQDAFIIATALFNDVTYFLSNDEEIVKQINGNGLMNAFNLRNEEQRRIFRNIFLDTLAEELK